MPRLPFRRSQYGQSMVEYAVVAAVMVLALFTPIDGKTLAQGLSDAVRDYFHALTYFISLP